MTYIWLAVSLAGLWLGIHWAFVLVMHAKIIYERGGLSRYWLVQLAPVAAAGLMLDLAFNLVIGTGLFLELPRELMFTSRVKRHVRDAGWRGRLAKFFARQLNQIDIGHV